jgi:hypothetical protein
MFVFFMAVSLIYFGGYSLLACGALWAVVSNE